MSLLPCRDPKRAVRAKGSTLLELLCALCAGFLILLSLMESVRGAMDTWCSQTRQVDMDREARSALRLLLDDWRSLVRIPADGVGTALPCLYIAQPEADRSSTRLAVLRTPPPPSPTTEKNGGDLCMALYAVVFTSDDGATSTVGRVASQKLVRRVLSTEETYRRLRAHLRDGLPLVSEHDWQELHQHPETHEPVAHHVVQFQARIPPSPVPSGQAHPAAEPARLELTLRLTSRGIARMLRDEVDWRGEGPHARLLHQDTPDNPNDDPEVRTYTLHLARDGF